MQSIDRLGVFVAGGPAPGINAVIKGVVTEADNAGIRVYGYLDGALGLVEGRFVHLTRGAVEDISIVGGSCIGTSRHQVDLPGGDLERIQANLASQGVGALISIGGEGTLQLADLLRRSGLQVVHVPKTIDNDIAGVTQTFGFDTAVNEAVRMLTAIKLDAETSGIWFVVEIMGRYTGHLALEAGLASGCTRVLIPEEGPIDVAGLVDLLATRAACGHDWGVILVSESVELGEGYVEKDGRLGGVGIVLSDRLEAAARERGIAARIRTNSLGHCLRCALPTGFDRSYAAKLGIGAVRLLLDPAGQGQMITIEDDRFVGVPIGSVAGLRKDVDLGGARCIALRSQSAYESARLDLLERQDLEQEATAAAEWLDQHATPAVLDELAMRLGVDTEALVESLADAARTGRRSPVAERLLSKRAPVN